MAARYMNEAEHREKLRVTLGDTIDNYIASKAHTLSPRTVTSYESIRKNYLADLMDMPIDKITKIQFQAAFDREAAGHSPKTLRCIHSLVSAAMGQYDLTLPKITLPQRQKTEMNIPTAAEIQTILDQFREDEDMRLAVMLAAYLGLRRSEICALLRSDYRDGVLTVSKAMVQNREKEWVIKQPKSTAGYRSIPVPQQLAEQLDAIIRQSGEQIVRITPDLITNRFVAARDRVPGITHFRFHDLRHYNASVMLALGVPNRYAMERMGHATDVMLKTVYQHIMEDKQEEFSRKINDFFKNTTQNTTRNLKRPENTGNS